MKRLTTLFFILISSLSYGQVIIRSGGGSTGGHGKPKQEAPISLYGNHTLVDEYRDTSKIDPWNAFAEQMEINKANINFNDLFKGFTRESSDNIFSWTESIKNPLSTYENNLSQEGFLITNYAELLRRQGIDQGPSEIVSDYQSFLGRQANLGNIYSSYLTSKINDSISKENIKDLLDHWQTDLATPSYFPRYQSGESSLDWNSVREDIEKALIESDISIDDWLDRVKPDSALIFKFEDRIYINPYEEKIEEVSSKGDTWLDMLDVRDRLPSPSMVDFEEKKVQIVIDGKEISLEDFVWVKEIKKKPYSRRIDL